MQPEPRRVLIVEDSRTVAAVLRHELAQQGMTAETCHDLASALERIREGVFDLVILDLGLPDVEGLEGLQAIKAARPELATVIFTGTDDAELAVKALQAGAQDYLVKGQHGQLLLRTLTFAFERNLVRKQLEELNEQKDRFLGMAAHDLRTPLTAISGWSELLLELTEDSLAPDQREMLNHIARSSQFMAEMLEDLLDIAAIERGRVELTREDHDLHGIVDEAVVRHSQFARRKDITLDLAHAPAPLVATVDRRRLHQVLDNLISNAIKYSPRGTTTSIAVLARGDEVVIRVRDQGPGIPVDEQAKLFMPFERASTRTTGGESSTGLGLAITKKIVDAHGGRVSLESTPGAGSTFEVVLPRGG